MSKRVLWSALDRLGLAGPAYRLAERLKAPRARAETGDDGLPLPPPLLMLQVVGHTDPDAFQRNGLQCARLVRDLAAVGFDYNPRLVRWVDANLPFAEARTNGPLPPLDAADGNFDLAYAFSVLTHLDHPPRELGSASSRAS